MAGSKKLEVKIIGDASSLSKAFGSASKAGTGFGSSLGRVAKFGALAAGAAGIGGLAVVLKQGIAEFSQAAKVGAQTGAVLKSTGQAAKISAKQVSGLAQSLMLKSGVDDEAIQSGENMLLTFTKIRNETGKGNDVFNQATKATLDLSVAMGKDMSSSAILVGKALNDPIKGMSALSKAGIQFTADQKKTIKGMVEAGDAMGAQKMILAELTTQFGGSAEAIGKTLPGQINILKESFSNLAGTVVSGLVPAFTKVMDATSGFVQRLGEADGAGAKMDVVWETIKSGVTRLGIAIRDAFNAIDWPAVAQTLATGLNKALAFLGSINYGSILKSVGAKVLNALMSVVTAIDWGRLGSSAGALLTTALNKLSVFVNSVNWNAVGQAIIAGMGRAIAALGRFLAGVNWPSVLNAIGAGINAVLKGLAGVLIGIATALGKAILTGIGKGLERLGPAVKAKMQALPGALLDIAAQVPGWAVGIGRAIVDGILSGLGGLAGALKSQLESTLRSTLSSLNPFSPVAHGGEIHIGLPLAEGAIRGWVTGSAALPTKMKESVRNAVEAARSAIEASRGRLADAFSNVSSDVLSAFDAIQSEILTKSEKTLAKLQAARDKAARAGAVTDARGGLAEAKGALAGIVLGEGEDPAAMAARMAAAGEAVKAAQKTLDDALWAQREFALQQKAAQERKERDASIALQRRHLEAALAAQLAAISKGGASVGEATAAMAKLLKRYDIDFASSGEALGRAFVVGLKETLTKAAGSAGALAGTVGKVAAGINVPKLDSGGTVSRTGLAVVHRGETFSGVGGGGGGGGVTVHVHGDVTGTELVEKVRTELIRIGRRNGSALGGLA